MTPSPDVAIEVGDVLIAIGTEPELRALEDLFAPTASTRWRASARRAASRRRSASSRARGRARAAEGRRRTATTRRTSRCRRREPPARPPREVAEELAAKVVALPEVERAEVAGPGLPQPVGDATRSSSRRSREIDEDYGGGSAEQPRADPGRDGLGEPDGPDHGRLGAERRLRRQRRAAARVRRARRRARVLLQRRRRARWTGSAPRSRPSGAARSRPRTATTGDVHRRARARRRATRCRAMLEQIEATLERFRVQFDSWAKQSELERELPDAARRAADLRAGRRALRRARRSSATTRTGVLLRSAGRAACRPTRRPTSRTCATSSNAASTARSTSSAPTTTASPAGTPVVARMLGYDPDARRGAALPARPPDARRRADEDVEAPRRRRLPRRLHRRGRRRRRALVPRQPRPRPDDRDRHRPRGREDARRTPSTTSSTRTPGSPAILRNAPAREVTSGPSPGAAGAAGARAGQAARRVPGRRARGDGAARPAGDPGVRDQASRTTSTASTTTSACSDPEHEAFRLALCRATQSVIARCLDLVGVEAPERDVESLRPMRVGMLTGGGDCPGLNPVIRAVCRRLWEDGHETFGVLNGWRGMIDGNLEAARLGRDLGDPAQGRHDHRHLAHEPVQDRGRRRRRQARRSSRSTRSSRSAARTRSASRRGSRRARPAGRRRAEDDRQRPERHRLHLRLRHRRRRSRPRRSTAATRPPSRTTGSSSSRRWAAMPAGSRSSPGIAGGADYILIPEQPVDYDDVAAAVERRKARGKNFSVIVASEGCELPGIADEGEVDDFGHVRVENRAVGETVAKEIEARTGMQARATVLGYIQRGGTPDAARPHPRPALRPQGGRPRAGGRMGPDGRAPRRRRRVGSAHRGDRRAEARAARLVRHGEDVLRLATLPFRRSSSRPETWQSASRSSPAAPRPERRESASLA